MQAVRQNVDPGVGPFDEAAIHPDETVELIEGNCHDDPPGPPPALLVRDASACGRETSASTRKLCRWPREGKFNEVPDKAMRTRLFGRNCPKSLSKITILEKIRQ
jgi:hypothetical protein